MPSEVGSVRVILEGLALIQQQEWFGDEVYVLVTPIRSGVRGKTVRHPGPKKHWKLNKKDRTVDSRIGPGVRPLHHELAHGLFTDGDQLELEFWEEDLAPIDPDDPLTIVTLHFTTSPTGRQVASLHYSRRIPENSQGAWIRPTGGDPHGPAVGAAQVVGKGGAAYGAYLRLESAD